MLPKQEKPSPSKRVSMASAEAPPPLDGNEPTAQPGFNNMFTPMLPPMRVDIQKFVDPSTPLPGVRVPAGEGEFTADNDGGGFIVYNSQTDRNLKERIIRKADQIASEMAFTVRCEGARSALSSVFTATRHPPPLTAHHLILTICHSPPTVRNPGPGPSLVRKHHVFQREPHH